MVIIQHLYNYNNFYSEVKHISLKKLIFNFEAILNLLDDFLNKDKLEFLDRIIKVNNFIIFHYEDTFRHFSVW